MEDENKVVDLKTYKETTSDGDKVEVVENVTEEFPDTNEAIEVQETPNIEETIKGVLLMFQRNQEIFYGIQDEATNTLYVNMERNADHQYMEKFDPESKPEDFGMMSVQSMQAKVTCADVLSFKEDDFYGYTIPDGMEVKDMRDTYYPHTAIFYSGPVESVRSNIYYMDNTHGILTYPIQNNKGELNDTEFITKFINHLSSGKGQPNFSTIMLPGVVADLLVRYENEDIYIIKNVMRFEAIALKEDDETKDRTANIFNILENCTGKKNAHNIAYVTKSKVYYNGYELLKMPKIFMALGIEDPENIKMMEFQRISSIVEAVVLETAPKEIINMIK